MLTRRWGGILAEGTASPVCCCGGGACAESGPSTVGTVYFRGTPPVVLCTWPLLASKMYSWGEDERNLHEDVAGHLYWVRVPPVWSYPQVAGR